MKKLQLKALELGATELLTREQLKNVLGGDADWVTCVWTFGSGRTATVPCSYSASFCQGEADKGCQNDDRCYDVDCR